VNWQGKQAIEKLTEGYHHRGAVGLGDGLQQGIALMETGASPSPFE
jgi:hypothetical protein